MTLSSSFLNERLTQGHSLWNPPLKNNQPRSPWPLWAFPFHGGENCASANRLPVRGEAAEASCVPESWWGAGRWLPALGAGQCLAMGPSRHPEATEDSSEDASRQGPGTQETRTTLVHHLVGFQGARRPAAEVKLPLSDCRVRPTWGPET